VFKELISPSIPNNLPEINTQLFYGIQKDLEEAILKELEAFILGAKAKKTANKLSLF